MKPVLEKYLAKPFPGSSHDWALNYLRKLDKNSSILDIGCGSGPIGKDLSQAGFTNLYAIEVDEAARKEVAPYYREVATSHKNLSTQSFDTILILDVLEHLAEPKKFLLDSLAILKPNGQILISVPNIAHWSIRLPLLFGFFEYTDRGILDRTHLQFFTRRRFKKFLAEAGLGQATLAASLEPVEFVLPKLFWDNNAFKLIRRAQLGLAQYLPGLLGYQHLALSKKF